MRTCVSKLEIVLAVCVPVWLARANGSAVNLAAVIVPSAISAATIVPFTMSEEVIVPARFNLLYEIAAEALMSALTIAPVPITVVRLTLPEPSKDTADASTSPVSWKSRAVVKALAVVAVVAVLAPYM